MRLTCAAAASTALALLAATPASATQTYPVRQFNGTYDLEWEEVWIDLHLAAAAPGASWAADVPVLLDVDGIDASEEEAIWHEVHDPCADALGEDLGAAFCAPLADAVAEALVTTNDALLAVLPVSVRMSVSYADAMNWLYRALGVYPATGAHFTADGPPFAAGYALDNNDGASNGHFFTGGFVLNGAGAVEALACLDSSWIGIDGRIDRTARFAMGGSFTSGRDLTCAGGAPGYEIVADIGLAMGGDFTGQRRFGD
ncbi:hypothetical protein L6R50_15210 [Myxococcota bacterium]|nr:hypothetical protein [Myxococcota bacterium]